MIINCENISTTTTQCIFEASTSPQYINGFSYGEVLQTFLIFSIFCIILLNTYYKNFFGIKLK